LFNIFSIFVLDSIEPQARKRKIYEMDEETQTKCRKLEEKNEELNAKINTLIQNYEKQLYEQANMFKAMIKREKMKTNLERKKTQLFDKKCKRRQRKIDSLMKELKSNK